VGEDKRELRRQGLSAEQVMRAGFLEQMFDVNRPVRGDCETLLEPPSSPCGWRHPDGSDPSMQRAPNGARQECEWKHGGAATLFPRSGTTVRAPCPLRRGTSKMDAKTRASTRGGP